MHPLRLRNLAERLKPIYSDNADVPDLRIIDQALWQAVQDRLEGVRQSARSRKIRRSEFWKNRRPKHLLTGLIRCAECDNAMAAVGSDYLACAAARSGAGCNNTKGIKRTIIEHAVLEGLKTRLMAPDLVEEFIREFQVEVNKQRTQEEAAHRQINQELRKVSARHCQSKVEYFARTPTSYFAAIDFPRFFWIDPWGSMTTYSI